MIDILYTTYNKQGSEGWPRLITKYGLQQTLGKYEEVWDAYRNRQHHNYQVSLELTLKQKCLFFIKMLLLLHTSIDRGTFCQARSRKRWGGWKEAVLHLRIFWILQSKLINWFSRWTSQTLSKSRVAPHPLRVCLQWLWKTLTHLYCVPPPLPPTLISL